MTLYAHRSGWTKAGVGACFPSSLFPPNPSSRTLGLAVAGGQQHEQRPSPSAPPADPQQLYDWRTALPADSRSQGTLPPPPPPPLPPDPFGDEEEGKQRDDERPPPPQQQQHDINSETKNETKEEESMRDSTGSEYKSDVQYQSFKDALHEGDPAPTGFCVKRGRLWCIRRPADRCGVALLALAALLLVGGITAPWSVDYLVERGIDSQTVLKGPSGKAFTTFVESGANLGLKIRYGVSYLNLTNPEAVLRGGRPVLQEVGPFVYHEHRKKVNVTFSADGREASFVLHKYYTFDAEATPGGLVDARERILTAHPVTQVLQVQLESTLKAQLKELVAPAVAWLAPLQRAVDAEIDESGLWKTAFKLVLCQGSPMGVSPFTVQTARDLYWGYHGDPILLAMQRLVGAMQQLAARVGKKLPLPVVRLSVCLSRVVVRCPPLPPPFQSLI